MDRLNYHHLRYFREVAHEGNLTRTADRLHLSQSALSTQIRQLEDRLGHALFERAGRQLTLTEAGRIALDHADRVFGAGEELIAALGHGIGKAQILRVGAVSTLSRNFQLQFLRPVLGQKDTRLSLHSGGMTTLLEGLRTLALDVVLSTEVPARSTHGDLVAHRISEQAVGLYGHSRRLHHASLEDTLRKEPVILPTESPIRTGFDSLVMRLGVRPKVVAEVDDMAMVRLLTRENLGLCVVPPVVLADELAQGILAQAPFHLDIGEPFYAITTDRRFPHPLLAHLLDTAPAK